MNYIKLLAAISLIATISIMITVLLRRDIPKIRFFRLTVIVSVIYLIGYFMEISAPGYDAAYYAVIVEYLGVPYIAPLMFLFVLDLHNSPIKHWYTILFAYPVLETILVITWPMNGIFYSNVRFAAGPPLSYLHVETTFFHTFALIYMFALIILSLVFVIWYTVREGRVSRRREVLVLAALASPFVGLVLYAASIVPYDVTPIGIAITVIIIYYSVFRYNQLDLLPVAKDKMLEQMKDAYLMVDDEWRFFDANQQARNIFPALHSVVYGANLLTLSPEIAELKNALDAQTELVIERNSVTYSYRPSKTEFEISKSKACSCILLYENTDTWQRMSDLQQKASYDTLTGVYNRSGYIAKTDTILESAKSNHTPLAVLLFDLDLFKEVNDTYGHQCGDIVLRGVAQRLNGRLRQGDIFGRWGGEEFCACLPNVSKEDALSVANNLRKVVASRPYDFGDIQVSVTVSIGVCIFDGSNNDTTMDALIAGADNALYMAKKEGRDCVRQCEFSAV